MLLLFSPSFSRALCPHPLRLHPLPNGEPAGEPCFHPPLASRSDTFPRPMRPLSLVGPWRTTGPAHDPVSETFQSSFFVGLESASCGQQARRSKNPQHRQCRGTRRGLQLRRTRRSAAEPSHHSRRSTSERFGLDYRSPVDARSGDQHRALSLSRAASRSPPPRPADNRPSYFRGSIAIDYPRLPDLYEML